MGIRNIHPTENQIETQICDFIHYSYKEIFFWKQPNGGYYDAKTGRFRRQKSPFAIPGVSDLLLVWRGRLIAMECKSEVGKQSDDQKTFEEKMVGAGGFYFLVRSIQDVEKALDFVYKSLEIESKPCDD